jgi:hypothetical protein
VVSALSTRDGGGSTHVMENGVIAKSQWETVAYGAWSLDASARTGGSDLGPSEQGQGGTITLRQRGMPFDGGWQADNALGDINTPTIGLAQFQPRFYLPTAPMQGLATAWRGPDGLQLVAGGGVPGLFDGIEVPDFRTLDGSTATAGAQWSASKWTVGGQLVEAHDVNLAVGQVIALPDDTALISSTTGLVSAAWADHGEHLQLNLLDGEVSGKASAVGGWVDGSITQGRVQQSAGIFRIDPNLTWGNQVIADDMQGGYYRFDYQSRQWMFDAGIDEVHSVSGLGSNTTFLTGDTRYQMSRDWGIGSVANVSRTDAGTNWSLEGYIDHANSYGTGRAQADYAETQAGEDAMLTLDQTWSTFHRRPPQHFDVGGAYQRCRHQRAGTGRHPAWFSGLRRRSIHASAEPGRQCTLGGRGARPSCAGRVRQCLVDLPTVPELADPGHVLRQPDRFLDAAKRSLTLDAARGNPGRRRRRARPVPHVSL